ncbi:MAG: alpha/beta fold hydrolase [Chromatiales bacterium]|jgi:pimeloyl-ACP methyl ester carboxylesterase
MRDQTLELHVRQFGEARAKPLLLLHGLFGSSVNWLGIVRRLQDRYRLIVPDLRNHGRSPHGERMDYPVMAADISRLLERLELQSCDLIGHSMGGKVAMWLALTQPDQVGRLVVADVAPVDYAHRFESIFSGLQAIDLIGLADRQAADRQLSAYVEDRQIRGYLLQNLVKQSDGWVWRLNLPVLKREIAILASFPPLDGKSFPGDALFIYGGNSDYVQGDYFPAIRSSFPFARMRSLAGAGHWVYADQPEGFIQALDAFL